MTVRTPTLLVVLMGSPADREHAAAVVAMAERLGLTVEQRVGSAHKTPRHVLSIIEQYEADPRPTVWVTIAGRSNALSAFVDAAVGAPVIACPPPGPPDDLWSSVRMPADVAPMLVLDPANAALAAAKILAQHDPAIAERLAHYRTATFGRVVEADRAGRAGGEKRD